jgi:Ubiquitin-activating enzyme E1 FCCH domain
MTGNAVVINFSGGETSPRSRGRFDQPWYQTSFKKGLNFISELQGPARFRPGFVFCYQTREGQAARLFDFQISDVLSYLLEFTPGYLRVRDPLTLSLQTTIQAVITGISNASTAVVTVSSITGIANGNEVILSGIVGMPQLNGKQVIVSNISGNTFQISDPVTGSGINTSALSSYTSGGIAAVVYELTTPYTVVDLPDLQVAAANGLMYLVCPRQAPYKLTVDAYGNFSINTFVRTNDPFALGTQAVTISDIRPLYVEDSRLVGGGNALTPGAVASNSGVTFSTPGAAFSLTDVGKYLRALTAQSDAGVRGSGVSSTLTPAATTGTGITFTASAAVFFPSDVGCYLQDLSRGPTSVGLALITAYTDSEHVTCTIIKAFGSTGSISAGAWAFVAEGYAKITAVAGNLGSCTATIIQSFGSTNAIAAGNWCVVTAETQVTLPFESVVNSTIAYTFAGVSGATQINGNAYLLIPFDISTVNTSQRYILRDTSNDSIDPSSWGVYTSGGTATPTSSQPSLTVTGITLGTDTIVTFASGAAINPNVGYTFESVGGTTQINGSTYFLITESDGKVHLQTAGGLEVNSTGWSAYTSGGIASASQENPVTVAFYEGRLWYGGTNQRPDCIFGSESPDNNGNSQYDNFTGGSNADNACFFQLAPTGGSTSFISWIRGGPDYMFCGTFGGPFRISGSGLDIPITPSSINVRQFDTAGCEETPSAGLQQMFFIQRAGVTLRSIKVINPYLATFESADLCLNAEQVAYSPLQRVVLQRGRPDCLWAFRADGQLIGMSVHITQQNADTLTGWHRHAIGGNGSVLDLMVTSRQNGLDQLWMVVQRTVNGAQRCYVEVMADDIYFPDPEDFFSSSGVIVAPYSDPSEEDTEAGLGSKTADLQNWMNAVWRLIGECVYVDAELAYDGSSRGVTAGATLTPSAVGQVQQAGQAAVSITLTASKSVFLTSDVGSEIWVKPNAVTGLGAGRATITAYISGTQVSAVVTVPFSSTNAINAGDWYFTVSTFYGFGHLEGQSVAVMTDGAVFSDGGQSGDEAYPLITVTNGTVTLPAGNINKQPRAAIMRAGFPYLGLLETHNLEMGGRSGPAQAKPRNIVEIYARFMNTLGAEFGTNLYRLQKIEHRLSDAIMDRGAPVFSGLQRLKLEDSWTGLDDYTREKNVMIVQRLPLPCVIESLDMYYDTSEDQSNQ